jgi:hypothetical protein
VRLFEDLRQFPLSVRVPRRRDTELSTQISEAETLELLYCASNAIAQIAHDTARAAGSIASAGDALLSAALSIETGVNLDKRNLIAVVSADADEHSGAARSLGLTAKSFTALVGYLVAYLHQPDRALSGPNAAAALAVLSRAQRLHSTLAMRLAKGCTCANLMQSDPAEAVMVANHFAPSTAQLATNLLRQCHEETVFDVCAAASAAGS